MYDMTVVGSGPNGLIAAYLAASHGLSVRVIEQASALGGGLRSGDAVEEDFKVDHCAAVHPLAVMSPAFHAAGIFDEVEVVTPPISYAHVVNDLEAYVAYRSIEETSAALGWRAGPGWRAALGPLVNKSEAVARLALSNPMRTTEFSAALRVGGAALRGVGKGGLRRLFGSRESAALFSGVSAHAIGEGNSLAGNVIGLTLATLAHADGWPIPIGGSQAIADALVRRLELLGVHFVVGQRVKSIHQVSDSRSVVATTTPKSFLNMALEYLPPAYVKALRSFQYGPGVFKLDMTLEGPIPWRDQRLSQAGTVHLGGDAESVVASERGLLKGVPSERPLVFLSQPTMFDPSRAPEGKHVVWTYVHVPAWSREDYSTYIMERIEEVALDSGSW